MGRTLKKINARMTKQQSDRHRLSIQTAKLVKRLQDASDGKVDMTPVALKATQILIDKSLPNLQAIEIANEPPPERTLEEVEAEYNQALSQLPVNDIKRLLTNMPVEERQALIESVETSGEVIELIPS